jgi:predicted HicB family RNase H-like nuclease
MQYKGYWGTAIFDAESRIFHGEVLGLRDVVTFQGTSVDELLHAFKGSVDDYLVFCKLRGETPEKPCSGRFVLRVPPELHRAVAAAAQAAGQSLNAWAAARLEETVRETLRTETPRRRQPSRRASKPQRAKTERPKTERPKTKRSKSIPASR